MSTTGHAAVEWSGEAETPEVDWEGDDSADRLRVLSGYIDRFPLLDKAGEIRLAKRIEQGDEEALTELIQANLRLVVFVAGKYRGHGLPLSDLVQEGFMALQRAAKQFDHSLGYKFSTYATTSIRRACRRAIASQSSAIVLPDHVHERRIVLERVRRRLTVALAREPTADELSAETGLDPEQIVETLGVPRVSISLNLPVSLDTGEELLTFVPDDTTIDPSEGAEDARRRRALRDVLATLADDERSILDHRFGLTGSDPLTQAEVAEELGLTLHHVRQTERRALDQLRPRLEYTLGSSGEPD